jgi:hypothetical protein
MKVWRISIMLAVMAAVIAAMLIPALKRAKIGGGPHDPPCILNLKLIQAAKEMYAEDHHIANEMAFTKEELLPYGLDGKWRQCPKGGEYAIGALHESPRCSYHTNLLVPTK